MEKCAEWLECDSYEQPSVLDSLTGIGSKKYKQSVCAVSGLLYNGGKIVGFMMGSGILGSLAGLTIGNNIGQALECLYTWMKSKSAKKTAEKYRVCLDDISQGHPLPYTDRQIAKLLDLMNIPPTVENIVGSYDKICLRNSKGMAQFFGRGAVFDNVLVDHAPGYTYVLCASVYSACPCVYNIQHGTLNEPDYITDENGVIVMENGELQMRNKEQYQKRYAKHCRIMRFRDLYEQTNDLPNLFHFSCNDMVGFSKGKLPITAPIVQCIEGTARNIFEMPILGKPVTTSYKENAIEQYRNDYQFVSNIVNSIANVIGVDKNGNIRRTQTDINNHLARDFSIAERIKIYGLLKQLWTKENAFKTEYTRGADGKCIQLGKNRYEFTQSNVTFIEKYFTNPAEDPLMFCCDAEYQSKLHGTSRYACSSPTSCPYADRHDYSNVEACVSDKYITYARDRNRFIFTRGLRRDFPLENSQINETAFPTTDIFDYYEEAKEFRDNLQQKYNTVSTIYGAISGADLQETNYILEYTLFDVFRNRIKAVAGIFLVLWFFIIGWKFINGDTKLLKFDEFIKTLVKIGLCWLIVFDDGVKNELFRLVMQVAQGSVQAANGLFATVRSEQDNLFNQACNKFDNTASYSATKVDKSTGPLGADGRCNVDFCIPPAGTALKDWDYPGKCYSVIEGSNCHYYALTCKLNGTIEPHAFHCERYLVRDGVRTDVCLQGHCDATGVDYTPVPPFSRPYKIYEKYDHGRSVATIKPSCKSGQLVQIFSPSLNQKVYACKGGIMNAGYKLGDLITAGIIEDVDIEKEVFYTLYNEEHHTNHTRAYPPDDAMLKQLVIPTSVADIDIGGRVTDIDFVDANHGTELYKRFQYSKYLVSKVNAANEKANYPIIKENGFWHNYSMVGFWDKLDCKFLQYLTFSMSGNGLDDSLANAVKYIRNNNYDGATTHILNGVLQIAKFLIMAFPFGVLVFAVFFGLAIAMFMMIARATQKYCVCVFNLVLTIYLSPIVFIMYLFDTTKKAMDTFIEDIKANVTGAVTPFITLSLFFFVLDWLMFGDTDKYIPERMFSGEGINSECYDGHESDAPIACLTKKLLDRFKLVAIFQMFIGSGPMWEGITWKMMWYLLLRLLVALVVFLIMTMICDTMEATIQSMIGQAPDTDLGIGFEGAAKDTIITGGTAMVGTWKTEWGIYKGTVKGAANLVKGLFGKGKKKGSKYDEKGSIGREGIGREGIGRGGLNDIGMGGANMNSLGSANMNSFGGSQGGGENGGDYKKGYDDGYSACSGGKKPDKPSELGEAIKGMFGDGSMKDKLARLGKATGKAALETAKNLPENVVNTVGRTFDAVGDYGDFVANNIKRLKQEAETSNKASEEKEKEKQDDGDKRGNGGGESGGSGGGWSVGGGLADDMYKPSSHQAKQKKSNDVKKYMEQRKNNKARDINKSALYGNGKLSGASNEKIMFEPQNGTERIDTFNKSERFASKEVINEVQKGKTEEKIKENRVFIKKDGNKHNNDN